MIGLLLQRHCLSLSNNELVGLQFQTSPRPPVESGLNTPLLFIRYQRDPCISFRKQSSQLPGYSFVQTVFFNLLLLYLMDLCHCRLNLPLRGQLQPAALPLLLAAGVPGNFLHIRPVS